MTDLPFQPQDPVPAHLQSMSASAMAAHSAASAETYDDVVVVIPPVNAAAYKIAAAIYEHGSMTEPQLFQHAEYCSRPSNRRKMIDGYVESRWFVRCGDKIAIGHAAIAHFDRLAEKEVVATKSKYVGQVAGARELGSVYARPPLSKRYMPSSRGFRADVPEYSVRDAQSFFTKA